MTRIFSFKVMWKDKSGTDYDETVHANTAERAENIIKDKYAYINEESVRVLKMRRANGQPITHHPQIIGRALRKPLDTLDNDLKALENCKYGLSKSSREVFKTLHPDLRKVVIKSLDIIDLVLIEGHRNEEKQNYYYATGLSKVKWPDGKHNKNPSEALDCAPYPINWEDTKRFYHMAGVLKAVAHSEGISLRWGGDWDNDNDFNDQKFNDLVHFERE